MDKFQEMKEYLNQNQLRKVLFGGYSKEDVQMKFDIVQAMLDTYAKEQAEKEAAMLADFEKQIEQMQAEFELQKKASDALIIDLNKSLAQLEEQNQSIVKEQQEVREANDALTAENQSIVQEQYKMKEAYKAYCGEILKKYSESLNTLSGEFNRMLENVSVMQQSISEETILEGFDKAIEMLNDNNI